MSLFFIFSFSNINFILLAVPRKNHKVVHIIELSSDEEDDFEAEERNEEDEESEEEEAVQCPQISSSTESVRKFKDKK